MTARRSTAAAPALTAAAAAALFTYLRDSTFDFTQQQLPGVIADHGWTILHETPGGNITARSRWNLNPGYVHIIRDGDQVHRVEASLTGHLNAPYHVHDHFTMLAATATGILGTPTASAPGRHPDIRWEIGKNTVILSRLNITCIVIWTTTARQDIEDAVPDHPDHEWEELGANLRRDLMTLTTGDHIIITSGYRFVQVTQTPTTLQTEASGNLCLGGVHRLAPDDERAFRVLGWQEPSPPVLPHHITLPWPAPTGAVRALATTITRTLSDVFHTDQPADLTLRAWNDSHPHHLLPLHTSRSIPHTC